MSPKPLKPPSSFCVWGVWYDGATPTFWATRYLAEKERARVATMGPDAQVIEHRVWADADEAAKESQS